MSVNIPASWQAEIDADTEFGRRIVKSLANRKTTTDPRYQPPQVIEVERKKQSDAEEKIRILKETLAGLK